MILMALSIGGLTVQHLAPAAGQTADSQSSRPWQGHTVDEVWEPLLPRIKRNLDLRDAVAQMLFCRATIYPEIHRELLQNKQPNIGSAVDECLRSEMDALRDIIKIHLNFLRKEHEYIANSNPAV